jgi:hypothetical protein
MKYRIVVAALALTVTTTAFAWWTPSTAKRVQIDIKPCSNPNTINAKSHGVVPVAIYADEGFDVHDVIVASLSFLGARPCKYSYEDNYLMLHFYKDDMAFPVNGMHTVYISGYYYKNDRLKRFYGQDTIRITHSGK